MGLHRGRGFRPGITTADVEIAVSTSFTWLWYFLLLFCTVSRAPRLDLAAYYLFVAVAAGCALVVLAITIARGRVPLDITGSRATEWVVSFSSALASAAACMCAALGNVAGLLACGVFVGYFVVSSLLGLARIYARHGAVASGKILSLSLGLAFLLACLLSQTPYLVCAVALALSPLIASALMSLVSASLTGVLFEREVFIGEPVASNGEAFGARLSQTDAEHPHSPSSWEWIANADSDKTRSPGSLAVVFLVSFLAGTMLGYEFSYFTHSAAGSDVTTSLILGVMTAAALVLVTAWFLAGFSLATMSMAVVGLAGILVLPNPTSAGPDGVLLFFIGLGSAAVVLLLWSLVTAFALNRGEGFVRFFGGCLCLVCVAASLQFGVISPCFQVAGLFDAGYRLETAIHAVVLIVLVSQLEVWRFGERRLSEAPRVFDSASEDAARPSSGIDDFGTLYGLSEREKDVLRKMLTGRSRQRIADDLCISINTVGSHISHIYQKVGVHNSQELLDLVYQAKE